MRCVAIDRHTRDIVQHICAKLQSSSDSHCGSNFATDRTLKKIALVICVCEMNPINDIVCSLLETVFSRWKDEKIESFPIARPSMLYVITWQFMEYCSDRFSAAWFHRTY